jgi:hypothetical protein
MHCRQIFLGIIIPLLLVMAPLAAEPAKPLPPHPRLLIDQQDLAALRQKIQTPPFAQRWNALKAEADKSLNEPIELPPRGGNWSHNYVCPVHGTRLKQGKQIGPWQWEHICPTGPHTLLGDPSKATLDFDGNVPSGGASATDGAIRRERIGRSLSGGGVPVIPVTRATPRAALRLDRGG